MIKYRLNSSAYDRKTETISPIKFIYLSVEGNLTEKEYFHEISKFREEIGINARIDVHVLGRANKDTKSDPKYVIELLEEFINTRKNPEENLVKELIEIFDRDAITKYIEERENLEDKQVKEISKHLELINYDLEYRLFLNKYSNDIDEFGIVIDRDKKSHTKEKMSEVINHCIKNGYLCYISNPCFEFWLLMHLIDFDIEDQEYLGQIYENAKKSNKHTFVSYELSRYANHGKSKIKFEKNYLYNIDKAIKQSKKFELQPIGLIESIGSNIGDLIQKLRTEI